MDKHESKKEHKTRKPPPHEKIKAHGVWDNDNGLVSDVFPDGSAKEQIAEAEGVILRDQAQVGKGYSRDLRVVEINEVVVEKKRH